MKKYDKKSFEYFYLKKHWKSFIIRLNDLDTTFKFNKRLKENISQRLIVERIVNSHPELEKAYQLKEYFYNKMAEANYKNAKS